MNLGRIKFYAQTAVLGALLGLGIVLVSAVLFSPPAPRPVTLYLDKLPACRAAADAGLPLEPLGVEGCRVEAQGRLRGFGTRLEVETDSRGLLELPRDSVQAVLWRRADR